jgi:hypothetical protein
MKLTSALALCMGLAACGGGSSGTALDSYNGNGGGSGGSGDGDTGNEIAQIGNGSGDTFVAGEISSEIGDNALSAGGSTVLTVNVVDGGQLITENAQVTFNSPCLAAQEATLTPIEVMVVGNDDEEGDNSASNIVATSNGQASVKYTANGCIGDDLVKATTSYGGSVISATTTITVESDTVTSVSYVDSSPNYITLKGTGSTEASEVRFQVRGSTGAPVKGVPVSFMLNTTAGGLALVNDSAISGTNGYVATTVQSGNTPTSVRVTALTDDGIAAQSNELVVSTGLPDQNSVDLSASNLRPDGWNYNNIESVITVNLADAFNNPVPNGTPVYFTTNGGVIDSACLTGEAAEGEGEAPSPGICRVTWRSSNPRPHADIGLMLDDSNPPQPICANGKALNEAHCRGGRVNILATTIGNESFIDVNNNGLYDSDTDVFYTSEDSDNRKAMCMRAEPVSGSASSTHGCDDLGTPYIDRNFDGQYSANEEIATITGDDNAKYESGDGIYNGALCRESDASAGLCSKDSVLVRSQIMLVMSCDVPLVNQSNKLPGLPNEVVELTPGESKTIAFLLADCNGNGLPAETTLDINTDSAKGIEASITPEKLPGADDYTTGQLFISADKSEAASGSIQVELITPKGKVHRSSVFVHSVIPDTEE